MAVVLAKLFFDIQFSCWKKKVIRHQQKAVGNANTIQSNIQIFKMADTSLSEVVGNKNVQ